MHDRNGTPIKVGDKVNVPCVVTQLNPSEDYCNITLETTYGRRPDGAKERFYALNTGVIVLTERPEPSKSST